MAKKDDSIELSPKYGLNPVIPMCFFCGTGKETIILPGRIRRIGENGKVIRDSDEEAKPEMFIDYEPCKKCKEQMETGIVLIGTVEKQLPSKLPPIAKPNGISLYPTGSWIVAKPEFIRTNFAKDLAEKVISDRKCFVPQSMIDKIAEALKNSENKGDNE